MALIATAFFLLMMAVVQIGMAMWAQNALNFATQQAARCWAVGARICSTPSLTQSYAISQASGLNITNSAFQVTLPPCGHRVSATYSYSTVIGGLIPFSPTLRSSACMP